MSRSSALRVLVGAGLLAGLLIPAAQAATITIAPSADNTIYQGTDPVSGEVFEDNTCGLGVDLFTGRTNDGFQRRALLKFDIAGNVPAGSTINSVALTINVNRSGDNQDAPATLHRLLADWGEGTTDCTLRGGGQGSDAAAGDATWIDAFFQQTPWGNAGGDFTVASATTNLTTRGDGTWDSNAGGNGALVVDVQAWLDSPGSNFGWIVVGDESRSSTTRRFGSREGTVSPSLTIDFTPTGDVYACCFADGACSVTDTTSCSAGGGTPDTNTATCSPNPCPQPVGACCNLDESCSDNVARDVCEAAGGFFNGAGSSCSAVSCGLEPFVDALPVPAVAQPTGTRGDGVLQYQVTMTEQAQVLHRDLPATDVWTYNGTFPGPTIEATANVPLEVTYTNSLPNQGNRRGGHYLEVDTCPHGPNYWQDSARAVVHLHGAHVQARFDGVPEYHILPGQSDVYEYPNTQLPATLWYHDHALGITRLNVYMGMAAYYLIRDDFENNLGLPSGAYEVPIVIQDREFNPDGSFFYPPTLQDAFFGDKVLANGKVWPFFNVAQGKYRFRFLNGSQARTYQLRLENLADPAQVIPFQLIGTDGGLISAPIALNDFLMAPAERFDVVVDFSGFPAGTEIVLRNDDPSAPRVPNVLKFVVQGQAGLTGALPATLRQVDPIPISESVADRRFELERIGEACAGGEWVIRSVDGQGNELGKHWDDITEFPVLGTTEIWEFDNLSNMMHPMHVHLVMFQVLDRTDKSTGQLIPLEPWEVNSWKDTVRVPAGTRVRVIARFEDYGGRFPYHCHILDHEDHEMMRQYQATYDPALCDNDGVCEDNEDCVSCANDCGLLSGASCGNGLCEPGDGEDCVSCPADCAGKQKGGGGQIFCCGDGDGNGAVLNCGMDTDGFTVLDDRCTTGGFYCRIMPRLAACCGDQMCEGAEDDNNCAVDCSTGGGGCVPTANRERRATCSDGIDNDCDGLIDGDDPDC